MWYVWCRVLLVCLGGCIFGYELGSMSGVTDMVGYRQSLNLSYHALDYGEGNSSDSCDAQDDTKTSAILGLIVSLLAVGSLVGALAAGVVSDLAGRKPTVIVGGILVASGGILHSAAVNLWMVLLSRIIGGLGAGTLYQVAPLYIAEISPEKQRGRLLSFVTIYAIGGNTVGVVMNLIVKNFLFGWRISVGFQFVLGAVLALGMLLLPRSPRWLAKRHRDAEALKVLSKIYKDQDRAQTQLKEIKSTVSSAKEPFLQTLKYITQWKILQRLLLGFFLFVIGRFTGINFIAYFSVLIFCGIGLPGFVVTIALPVVSILGVLLSSFIVDKFGRKPIFLIGTAIMSVSHIISATLILAFDLEGVAVAEITVSQRVAGYFVLVSVCIFIGFATLSIGNLTWMIVNEIFPLKNRGFMVAISTSGFWVGLITSNQISSVLISNNSPFKISGTLFLFAAITFMVFLYILLLLPETKGLTLEKMEELFSKPWLERTNVLYYLSCGCFKEFRIRRRKTKNYQLLAVPVDEDSPPALTDSSSMSNGSIPLVDSSLSNGSIPLVDSSLSNGSIPLVDSSLSNGSIPLVDQKEHSPESPDTENNINIMQA